MIKIAHVLLESRIGGPQIEIIETVKQLREDYNIENIIVFPAKHSQDYKTMLDKWNIRHHSLFMHRISKNPTELVSYCLFFIPEVIRLKKFLKIENPDIVNCYGSGQWKGVIAAKIARKKVVWHLNDTKMPLVIRIGFKCLRRLSDGFIIQGEMVRRYYLHSFNKNLPIIKAPSPINTKLFNPENVIPHKKISSLKGIKILTIGNISPYKGIEYLVESANQLNKKYKYLHFLVAGNLFESQKKYIQNLQKKIKDYGIKNFHFLGFSKNIASMLKVIEIYVCPSIAEASPRAVWEAMSMEKAIVSTNVGSITDYIIDNYNGFIVPINDSVRMAEKIEYLINHPEKRKTFGKRARQIAVLKLDIGIVSEQYKRIYESILS